VNRRGGACPGRVASLRGPVLQKRLRGAPVCVLVLVACLRRVCARCVSSRCAHARRVLALCARCARAVRLLVAVVQFDVIELWSLIDFVNID